MSLGDYEWFVKMKLFKKSTDTLVYSSEITKILYQVK
jgi:hypothetical protein